MNSNNIVALKEFTINVKQLAKKYKNIKNDLRQLQKELQVNPKSGIHLFGNCYKIRLVNSSVPTGKSGGFRVIYYYLDSNENIFLLSIYSKSDQANLSDEKIVQILKNNGMV